MKQWKYILALPLMLGLGSCSEQDWSTTEKGDIAVSAGFADTRTTFTEDNGTIHVSWNKGDEISLFSQSQGCLSYYAAEESRETRFLTNGDKLQAAEGETVYACYPYAYNNEGHQRILLPDLCVQYYEENASRYDMVYASGQVTGRQLSLQFKHLFAFLKLNVPVRLLADRGSNGGLRITASAGIATYSADHFVNLENGEIMSDYSSIHIDYLIPQDVSTEGKETLTCYVALLPQPEGVTFSFSTLKDGAAGNLIQVKQTPAGGFKAGNVYSLYLDENSNEALLQKEREALTALYKATDGDHWTVRTNWCSDLPVSEWHGVEVNEAGLVRSIILQTNNLNGPIPEEIADLQFLSWLDLSSYYGGKPNKLKSLPERIGELTSLQTLSLCQSEIGGTLPEGLRHLTQLQQLNLKGYVNFENGEMDGEQYLTGEIPEWIGELKELRDIDLSCNHLTGSIPSGITQLEHLSSLCLNANELSGPIPEGFGKLPLRTLYLNGNNLTGSLPTDWGEMMARRNPNPNEYESDYLLSSVAIGSNRLTGRIPDVVLQSERFAHWAGLLLSDQQKGFGFDFSGLQIPAVKHTYVTLDGTSTINLGEEYAKSDYTLLYRWAEWCPGSQSTTPHVVALEKRYRNHGLQAIGAYAGSQTPQRDSYMKQTGLDQWRHFRELIHDDDGTFWSDLEEPIWRNWMGYGTPLLEVVDRQGNVRFISDDPPFRFYTQLSIAHPGNELGDFLKSLLGEGDAPKYYTSTDYSMDGQTIQLQQATVGRGIDLVFMGEGFVDRDMGDGGLYEQKMREAMEQYFSIEPYKSFRNRFNVFLVKVVSPNAEFTADAQRRINESDQICIGYWENAVGVNHEQAPQIAVIYNSQNAGRSYTVMYSDRTSVGYMKEGVNVVLNHEMGGHGFANLLDEYVEPGNEGLSLSEAKKDTMDIVWQRFGWGANVDWRNDAATVRWSRFLQDSRYAGEGLGLYEGSYLYGYGAYRPTENSMMRYNDSPFNAPSREQIYKRIMELSEPVGWTYDYEEFVKYDAINRAAATRLVRPASAETIEKWRKSHRPPVVKRGSWREAVQQSRQTIFPKRSKDSKF